MVTLSELIMVLNGGKNQNGGTFGPPFAFFNDGDMVDHQSCVNLERLVCKTCYVWSMTGRIQDAGSATGVGH